MNSKLIFGAVAAVVAVVVLIFVFSGDDSEEGAMMKDEDSKMMSDAVVDTKKDAMQSGSVSLSMIRSMAGRLTTNSAMTNWLASDNFLSRFVVLVDSINAGKVPASEFLSFAPENAFLGEEINGKFYLNVSSYKRYNKLASLVGKLPTRTLVDLYGQAEPMLEAEYKKMGHPPSHGKFRDQLKRALDKVVSVRVNRARLPLMRKGVTFQYEASNLENADDVQKLLYRMGPSNSRTIREKLSAVRSLL